MHLRTAGLVCAALVFGAGCRSAPATPPPPVVIPTRLPEATPIPPLQGFAPLGSPERPITAALTGDQGQVSGLVEAWRQAEPVLAFDVVAVDDIGEAYTALCRARSVDAALLDGLAALAAESSGCGELLYMVERDGATAQQAQIITAAGRGISGISGLAGQDFCRTPDESAWLVATLRMAAAGLDPFSGPASVLEVPTDEQVIRLVLQGSCDAGITAARAEQSPTAAEDIEDVRVLEVLPPLLIEALVISARLDQAERALLIDLLRRTQTDIAGAIGADGLIAAQPQDTEALSLLLAEAELEPALLSR